MSSNSKPELALIAAVARTKTIGSAGALPWHIPADLAYFRRTTLNHSVIMGRKTWESLGKPLKDRRNVVVTTNKGLQLENAEVATSLEEALALCAGEKLVFCVGGGQLYTTALPLASHLYLTEVHADVPGDTFFPDVNWANWRCVYREKWSQDTEPKRFDFVLYSRCSPK